MCGKLELILGGMFSGKSTELIRKIRILQKKEKMCLLLNHLLIQDIFQIKLHLIILNRLIVSLPCA